MLNVDILSILWIFHYSGKKQSRVINILSGRIVYRNDDGNLAGIPDGHELTHPVGHAGEADF
jgi:hypothetical protein